MSEADSARAHRVALNSAVLGAAKVVERATGFALALLLAVHLGVEGLGVFAAAWAVYGFIAIAGDAGTTNFLIREVSRETGRAASYTIHLSALAVGGAIPLMLIAQVALPLLGYSAEAEKAVSVVLLAILPRVLNGVQEALFITYGRVAFETLVRLVSSVAYLVAAAWILQRGAGVPAVLGVYVATEYVVMITYFVLINRYIVRLRAQFSLRLLLRIARDIRAFAASSILAAFSSRPEILVLSLMVDERQLGLFSAALRIAELPLLVPEVVMMNVFPVLSQYYGRAEERYVAWQAMSLKAMLAFSLPLAACLLAAPDALLRFLFPDDFAAASDLLRLLAVNVVSFAMIAVLWRSLVARGRQTTNVIIQSVMIGVRLGMGIAAIAVLGTFGAALAATAASVMQMGALGVAVARSGAPPRVPTRSWLLASAAAATGVTVWLLATFMPILVSLGIGALVYLGAIWATGAVTFEDRVLLRRLRRSSGA